MAIIPAFGEPPPADAVEEAVRALAAGDIVGLPTDTVYGLAADPFRTGASDRLFQVKARPRRLQLPVLVADAEQALSLTTAVSEMAYLLMERFWPGPLTIVLARRADLDVDLGDEDLTIGVRCPDHAVPRAVCAVAGPIAVTSANRHGESELRTAAAVAETLGATVDLVLDAGPCLGTPSTVVDCTGVVPKLLREGHLSWASIIAGAPPS
jgi:L-threonylcarbamoyladenylate synthase